MSASNALVLSCHRYIVYSHIFIWDNNISYFSYTCLCCAIFRAIVCLRRVVVREFQNFYIFLCVYWSFEAFSFSTGCCFYPVAVGFLYMISIYLYSNYV